MSFMRFLRKAAILAAGWALVAAGAILIPLPGPGVPVLLAGLAVLSLKSAPARLLLMRLKGRLRAAFPEAWPAAEKILTRLRRGRG